MSPEYSSGPQWRTEGTRSADVTDGDNTNSIASTDKLAEFAGPTSEQAALVHNWLADSYGLRGDRLAYVVLVELGDTGKYRRRPYMTLHAALAATRKAEARGVTARVGLFELVALGEAE